MSTPLGGRFYHTLTKKSTARLFYLPIPEGHKVLSAGVRIYGATGILCSFYDVDRNAWVVQQDPIEDNAAVLLQVLTLVDPDDVYDVVVSMVSLTDHMTEEEVHILTQRTEMYRGLIEEVTQLELEGKYNKDKFEELREKRKSLRESSLDVVSLICPTVDGYTLTGGGFSSGYPILASHADIPESHSVNRFCSSLTQESCSSDFFLVDPIHTVCDTRLNERQSHYALSVLSEKVGKLRESHAWSVMAAENPSFTCYAIGLRLHPTPQSISFDTSDKNDHSSHLRDGITPTSSNITKHSHANNNGVKVEHRAKGRWSIELQPPHGRFYFTFGASYISNPIMLLAFYK
ncbi:uncharacterized protein TM35_000171640 [Trypanosoma theileri]|uniref:Uncharacterized protein n=1 Tax=Trypanosoma theileri TaxID=67003 RepID=A0A1X0NUD6_9TRYP|nr:uncharacterized protein TM35_000171640 [Trypanosoma theileri]ORC88292.1 hypothetical protein TM35_000171640 [Trypanosoma theileri]